MVSGFVLVFDVFCGTFFWAKKNSPFLKSVVSFFCREKNKTEKGENAIFILVFVNKQDAFTKTNISVFDYRNSVLKI